MDEEPVPEDSVKILESSKLYESDNSGSNKYMMATTHNDHAEKEFLNLLIKIGNISPTLPADSEIACTFLNQSLTMRDVTSSSNAIWVRKITKPQLRIFSNEPT